MDGDYIRINFLDQQLAEITEKHNKLSKAGKDGVIARERKKQATLKPPLSIKDKDKDNDKEKEEIIATPEEKKEEIGKILKII